MANKITSKQHKGEEVLQKNLVHKIHKKTVYNQLLGGQAGTAALVEKRSLGRASWTIYQKQAENAAVTWD